jgi:two-component SAPR family response regulator
VTQTTITLLGSLQVVQGGRVITSFRTQKTGALLAYLAFYRQHPHSRSALASLLWPEAAPNAARHKLRVALSSLRRQLEPPDVPGAVFEVSRASVQLQPASVTTDIAEFEAALRAARRSRSGVEREQLLTEAVNRYRGELLPDHLEDWVQPERQRLAEALMLITFINAGRDSGQGVNLFDAWHRGDIELLTKSARESYRDFPLMADRFLSARNRNWIPKIEEFLRSGKMYFVVVGAAHLGGTDGVVSLLRARGYKLEQL